MDNFTHSLAGWALSRAGLARKTGLATATLVLAANLPDIDAVASLLGMRSLAIRRGITHGPLALVILPLLLVWAMAAFDRWQARRGARPPGRRPLDTRWLLALAYIGILTHPALDYLNSYGIRLLEPFSPRWYYGDTLFIIDVWIWSALALGIWLSRRREKAGRGDWQAPAIAALAAVCLYIAGNGFLTARTEYRAATAIARQFGMQPDLIVASPVPAAFWRREMLWQTDDLVGFGSYSLFARDTGFAFPGGPRLRNMELVGERVRPRMTPDTAAFLFWARMPYADLSERRGAADVRIRDARFSSPMLGDRFSVRQHVPARSSADNTHAAALIAETRRPQTGYDTAA